MTRSWLLNAALLAAIAALAAFIYLKPKPDETGTFPLSALKADEITLLRLERASRPQIVLEKTSGQWLITAPIAARADPLQVQRLLAILDARAPTRLAAADLARFDLDRPVARLTLNTQAFSFGLINTVAREQYVLTGNTVYPVELRYGAALPADVTQLISKQLFADGEVPVVFEFSSFAVRRVDGKWITTSNDGTNPADALSQDDLHRWVDNWRLASALRVAPHAASRAQDKVKIKLENGTELTLAILQREPELVLLRPDLGLQYSFVADAAKRLLVPPASKP
ncbi:MAG: DUF4340 domain-containing protein [Burkholderiales bacterium]|nr:DUF4340 domain-containing protein [Burkholderiales bacterium]